MTERLTPNKRLFSWKEIAAHLGVDERTCQRWETKYGLPVHRLDEKSKSRVFAWEEDLDRWLENIRGSKSRATEEVLSRAGAADPAVRGALARRALALVLAFAAIAAVLVLFVPRIVIDRRPADFRIEGSELSVLNKGGRELWRYDTGMGDLLGEANYRERFQYKRRITNPEGILESVLPLLMFTDLDADGKPETLFSPKSKSDLDSGRLLLFDHRGELKGTFDSGVEVRSGETLFSSDFVVTGFLVLDLDNDLKSEIVLISHVRERYPTRLLVLNRDLTIRGEYWHAGQIEDVVAVDLDRDEFPDLVAVGQNNEYNKPCFIVLDGRDIRGASPQGPKYAFAGLPPGSERLYILFPRTAIDDLYGPGIAAHRIDLLSGQRIQVNTRPSNIFFELDYDGGFLNVTLSHDFVRRYEAFVRVPFDSDQIRRDLASGLLWHDGPNRAWVPRRAPSNPR